MTGEDVYHPNTDYIGYSNLSRPDEQYLKIIKASSKLIPFYHYYFDYYLPQKKVVVLSYYTKLRMYDEHLYKNFTK